MIGKAVQTRDAYHRTRSSFTKIPREKDEDTQSTGITARQFSIDPKRSHERAIIGIGRYLLTSRNRGIIYQPDTTKGLDLNAT
eukprot:scaffold6720_cov136-Skeletonema_dohrnii-CCMP3373.AAC.18